MFNTSICTVLPIFICIKGKCKGEKFFYNRVNLLLWKPFLFCSSRVWSNMTWKHLLRSVLCLCWKQMVNTWKPSVFYWETLHNVMPSWGFLCSTTKQQVIPQPQFANKIVYSPVERGQGWIRANDYIIIQDSARNLKMPSLLVMNRKTRFANIEEPQKALKNWSKWV